MNRVLEFIHSLDISKTDYIVVGCSGGPDSMCLLSILKNNGYNVVVAHVNHNIRKESKDEYIFLQDYCKKNKIIFEGLELPENLNENEFYYRRRRYTFYKDLAKKYKTDKIMTAHHGDDLIETVLMRITRGSNIKGYLGFPKVYDEYEYKIIKPLMYMTKDEIIEYNNLNDIPYVIDKTNEEDIYTRNRYRHNILDFLKKEDKNVHLKYLKYSEELESISNYIDKEVKKAIDDNYENKKINVEKFQKLDPLIQKKEIELILRDLYRDDIDKISDIHTNKILDLLAKGKNFKFNLPLDYIVKREYNNLFFEKATKESSYKYELNDKVVLNNGDSIELIESSNDYSNNVIRLRKEDIKLPLYVRNRLDGDKIEIKNLNGTKKVKSIFIDEKIEPSKRDTYPIVVDSNNTILWLPGIKKSKFDIKKEEKCDIILKYTKGKE